MTIFADTTRRLLLAGGFVLAAAAPIAAAVAVHEAAPVLPAVASCPDGEVLDPASGACRPATGQTAPTFNPINPEGAQLQPGSITSSEPGQVGRLPEVNGIPCDGANTGQCIGLSENSAPAINQPQSTISSSP